ncbi:hypothetical protein PT974_07671 [Cladobotryum mycophilum]|uniref:Uncharacterized protein n=1 Tax=Cladobotryum mycophilum TaxID=491253 RepID=A0ABR0SPX1_9HYPO
MQFAQLIAFAAIFGLSIAQPVPADSYDQTDALRGDGTESIDFWIDGVMDLRFDQLGTTELFGII